MSCFYDVLSYKAQAAMPSASSGLTQLKLYSERVFPSNQRAALRARSLFVGSAQGYLHKVLHKDAF